MEADASLRTLTGEEAMKDSGKYRVTHHLGRRPDSEDAEVIFSYPDEEPARRFGPN